jgi:hypothetical protein
MPDVFELTPQDVSRLPRQIRLFAFERLPTAQFIQTDRALCLPGSFGGLCIDLAPLHDFPFPLRVGHCRQPVSEAVRLQPPFLSR